MLIMWTCLASFTSAAIYATAQNKMGTMGQMLLWDLVGAALAMTIFFTAKSLLALWIAAGTARDQIATNRRELQENGTGQP